MDQDNNYISRDRSCKEFSIEFSCVHPIQGSSLKSTLRLLSCNKWHTKKYQELQEIRKQSIYSNIGGTSIWLSKTSERTNCLLICN